MKTRKKILASVLSVLVAVPLLPITASADTGGWTGVIFGNSTSTAVTTTPTPKNSIVESAVPGEFVKLMSNNGGGKVASDNEGMDFYYKEMPGTAHFDLKAHVKVNRIGTGTNTQHSFGIMLRSHIGTNNTTTTQTANYVAVGGFGPTTTSGFFRTFYKQNIISPTSTTGTSFTETSRPAVDAPVADSEYDMVIKKRGNAYSMTVNGKGTTEYLTPTATGGVLFANQIYAGLYAARDVDVTFTKYAVTSYTDVVTNLTVDASGLQNEYLVDQQPDFSRLVVKATLQDGSEKTLQPSDYIVTGFSSKEPGVKTAKVHYNGAIAEFSTTVVKLDATALDLKYLPAKTDYYPGDLFDPDGLTVIGNFNNGYRYETLASNQYTLEVTDAVSVTGATYRLDTPGLKKVTVRSTVTTSTYTTFGVQVKDATLTGLEIRQQPAKTSYFLGEAFEPNGLAVYAHYSDGSEVRLRNRASAAEQGEYAISGFSSSSAGPKTVTLTYKNLQASLNITVREKALSGIKVTKYPKTTFTVGDAFDSSNLVVSKVYDNGDLVVLDAGLYDVVSDAFQSSQPGVYDIAIIPKDTSLTPISYKAAVREPLVLEWKSIRFGQSTSNTNNTVTVLKDGATLGERVIQLAAKDGAGKITGDHDGISFYYTELDADADNFVLSADIKVIEYAKNPHDGQEAFGITARDAIGNANDSAVFASNIAAIGGYSGGTTKPNGTQLLARTGVEAPNGTGSKGIQNVMLNDSKPSGTYRLTLSKTNSGFTGRIGNGPEETLYVPGILNVQDNKMYVGFYTARVATIEVSNIQMSVTASAADAPKVEAPKQKASPDLQFTTLDKTSNSSYVLGVKPTVNGWVTLKQNGQVITSDRTVLANQTFIMPTTVTANTYTNFSAVFVPDDSQLLTSAAKMVRNFTVNMKSYADGGDIIVSPTGTETGLGTVESPLDLDTAIAYVKPGQTILLQDGRYLRKTKVDIRKYNDGTEQAMKKLMAAPGARPILDFGLLSEGVVLSGNYWHVKGIEVTRTAGNTKGFTVGGSHNIVEGSRFYANGDTGLQISSTDGSSDKSSWPSYNLILNNESFDNQDPSNNNADGFAAKLTSGVGNIFRGDISHNNIDDGWDLYTKSGTGAIGAVLLEDCIAYNNGTLTDGTVGAGDKNGFKLGGEGIHVPHIIRNSIAFGNGAYGFASNSNPGVQAYNNVAFNNARGNLNFVTYSQIQTDFRLGGFISYQKGITAKDNYPSNLVSNDNYLFDGTISKNATGEILGDVNFKSLTPVIPYARDSAGNILWGDFLKFIAPSSSSEDSTPTTPAAGAPAPAGSPAPVVNGSVIVPVEQKTSLDGKPANQAVVDSDSLTQAFKAVKDGSSKVTIELKGSESISVVKLPSRTLTDAAAASGQASVTVKAGAVSYTLPAKAIDTAALAATLGVQPKDVEIGITVRALPSEAAQAIRAHAQAKGFTLLAEAVDFNVTAEANGKTSTISDFGSTYITRTIELPGTVDITKATGVLYNPVTGEMTFVPTKFTTVGGKTTATLKRPGNSIYTVVQSSKTFADLTNHWAKADLELLASKALVNGTSASRFEPDASVTRAEFASLLVRGLGLTGEAAPAFTDVKAGGWYAQAVGAASKAKLIQGFDDGTFRPDAPVTREEMAVMLVRAMSFAGVGSNTNAGKLAGYADQNQVSVWARDGMSAALNAGIVNGQTADHLAPGSTATRAEATVMLKRFLSAADFIQN
ncbi:S-layer homology domain-containing protein [Gorillibacterium sp. sgz5001074]|uniref:S-layer homology domain-containing protein n=1 Tax=Gorillibacterium sp. sgz5001074 TaxID=3446695 RepID=UPI003F6776E0